MLDARPTIPYIKPFGERFDPSQLPYFKYRKALAELELERGACLEVRVSEEYLVETLLLLTQVAQSQ